MSDSPKNNATREAPLGLAKPPYDLRGMAHELRTPISAIIAFAEMIEREQFGPVGDERYRAYARDIQEAARLSLGVVAAGLEQGSEPSELLVGPAVEVDIEQLGHSLMRMFAGSAQEADVRLSFEAPALPLKLMTDASVLKQILLNLIGNAIKFTPPKGSVSLVARLTDGRACLMISDTGLGMTRSDTNILIGDSGPNHHAAKGIGFTMVRRLSAALGAVLQVESSRGAGTSVSLLFNHSVLPKAE